MVRMSLTVDIAGVPPERFLFAASPLAELTAMLHVLAAPPHHPGSTAWATRTRAALRPELSERLSEAEFLWRSSRADFLLPARPGATLSDELDALDALDDDTYVSSALVITCGSDRTLFGLAASPPDSGVRGQAMDLARARGPQQAAFAERLMADPRSVRARVRETLAACGPAFFDVTWAQIRPQIAADLRLKADLLARRGLAELLHGVSSAVSLDAERQRIVVDELQDSSTTAAGDGVTFIPSLFGSPHLVCVHAPGWRPVLQYPLPVATVAPPVPLELVRQRLEALSHPMRIRLVRTLSRGAHTTGELASAWEVSPPEVSRHLTVLRKAGLLLARRQGRYVHYELDTAATGALGTDLLQAIFR
jgi:DNA-binding transcriptional ArsR family regulator